MLFALGPNTHITHTLFCNVSRAVCSFGHALCCMRFAKASARHTVTLFKHEAVARSRSHLTSHMYIIPQVNICVVFGSLSVYIDGLGSVYSGLYSSHINVHAGLTAAILSLSMRGEPQCSFDRDTLSVAATMDRHDRAADMAIILPA